VKLQWTVRAQADRRNIFLHIAADNPIAALAVDEAIRSHAESLLEYPRLGRHGRLRETRELVIARYPYILIYQLAGETVTIARVLHQHQQWP
jgi:addiction module RelE/StbE family toxin